MIGCLVMIFVAVIITAFAEGIKNYATLDDQGTCPLDYLSMSMEELKYFVTCDEDLLDDGANWACDQQGSEYFYSSIPDFDPDYLHPNPNPTLNPNCSPDAIPQIRRDILKPCLNVFTQLSHFLHPPQAHRRQVALLLQSPRGLGSNQ